MSVWPTFTILEIPKGRARENGNAPDGSDGGSWGFPVLGGPAQECADEDLSALGHALRRGGT